MSGRQRPVRHDRHNNTTRFRVTPITQPRFERGRKRPPLCPRRHWVEVNVGAPFRTTAMSDLTYTLSGPDADLSHRPNGDPHQGALTPVPPTRSHLVHRRVDDTNPDTSA